MIRTWQLREAKLKFNPPIVITMDRNEKLVDPFPGSGAKER